MAKTRVVKGIFTHPFKFIKKDNQIEVNTDKGLLYIANYIKGFKDIPEEGEGTLIVKYNVRVEFDSNKRLQTSRAILPQDILAGIGTPEKVTFKFDTCREELVRTRDINKDAIYTKTRSPKDFQELMLDLTDLYIDQNNGEEIRKRNSKQDWTEDEAKVALQAYFKSRNGDTVDVKRAAEEAVNNNNLSRTVDSMVFKLVCYRQLDPQNNDGKFTNNNFGKIFIEVWDKYAEDYRKKYVV